MLQENLIKLYEKSFRENREMPALTDYFKNETFSYYEMAKEIAKLHLLFKKADIKQDDKIALIGRNNTRWCISYLATITYGATIVPILQDFNPNDIIHIINHSESKLLFLGARSDSRYQGRILVDRLPRDLRAQRSLADQLPEGYSQTLSYGLSARFPHRGYQVSRSSERSADVAELHFGYYGLLEGCNADL